MLGTILDVIDEPSSKEMEEASGLGASSSGNVALIMVAVVLGAAVLALGLYFLIRLILKRRAK